MGTIKGLYDRVKAADTDKIVFDSLDATEADFAYKNANQMFAGKRSDESDIEPAYTPLTVFLKDQKGQPYNRVTLLDTGDFYSGIRTTVEGDIIKTNSSDEKNAKLKAKYGDEIFGLGGEFKDEYLNEDLRPVFKTKIEEATGLTMK